MKNETIKTIETFTTLAVLKLLAESGGNPLKGFVVSSREFPHIYEDASIYGVNMAGSGRFMGATAVWYNCAKVTELDPCVAPDGCPELEPWMAYVGIGKDGDYIHGEDEEVYRCGVGASIPSWHMAGNTIGCFKAIDVRTAWAQEHFPEHCRIRNYQEPDAFEEWIKREFHRDFNPSCTYIMVGADLKDLYELNSK